MPNFEIVQSHSVTTEEARRRLERFSGLLSRRYELTPVWTSPTSAKVERAGARGSIDILPETVRVAVSLPFAFAPFRERIESRLRRELGYLFGDESVYDEAAYDQIYGPIEQAP